jgi:hypothetical protein
VLQFGTTSGRIPSGFGLFAFGGAAELGDFLGVELAMAAGFDVEDQRAVADAANFFDVVADFLEHLADFAIAAFDEDQFVPGIVGVSQEPDAGGGGHDAALIAAGGRRAGLSDLGTAIDHDAVAELVDRRERGLAADFDEVGFFDAGGGAGEGVGEVGGRRRWS